MDTTMLWILQNYFMFFEGCLKMIKLERHYVHIQKVMSIISRWLLDTGYKYFRAESAVIVLLRCRTAYL